jgi:CRP/FNR family transcriptional regulator
MSFSSLAVLSAPKMQPVGFHARIDASVSGAPTHCSTCNLREICLPCGFSTQEMRKMDNLVYTRRSVKRGESLYRGGDKFHALYAVRSGFFKTTQTLEDGREQVTGFLMTGEILGMDGIGGDEHGCNAIALEDSQVCVIPYTRIEQLSGEMPGMQRQFHRMMSREIVRDHGVMLLLGSMRAEERLAAFLLNLSQRFTARGYSSSEFNLRMTRDEIGSFLGLKLETVSRLFSRFHEEKLVNVRQKSVQILDIAGLRKVMGRRFN